MSTDFLIAKPPPSAATGHVGCEAAVDVVAEPAMDAGASSQTGSEPISFAAQLSDYLQLTKPRIVVMILITTVMTATIAAEGFVPVTQLAWLLLATGLVAASAGAANQVWERVIDGKMARTALRPLPDGRLGFLSATVFTLILGIAGTTLLSAMFGGAPAIAGAATWVLYVLAYTPMKTRSAWNTTVGAVAGALPVLIGYTALGGGLTDATGWLLVGVLVAWQYPHFMSIAWMYRRQYAEAGFRMTTTVEESGRSAGLQAIAGSIVLIACGVTLCLLPEGRLSGLIAATGVFLATLPMLKASLQFFANPTDALARRLLRSSLLVLPAVLAIATLRVFW